MIGILVDTDRKLNQGSQIDACKPSIIQFFLENFLKCKVAPPIYVLESLNTFISNFITVDDIKVQILPVMEKSLIRQPDQALQVITAFFAATALDTSPFLSKFMSTILTSARSSNSDIRLKVVAFFATLSGRASSDVNETIAMDLATPISTGRTASAEQRAVLFALLGSIPPSSNVSLSTAQLVLGQISKESNENVYTAMMGKAFVPHFSFCVANGLEGSLELPALTKAMVDAKPILRRSIFEAVGNSIWAVASKVSQSAKLLVMELIPGLDSSLRTASSNPLEAFVAVALCHGPDADWAITLAGKYQNLVKDEILTKLLEESNTPLLATGVKPSFLLNEKVYRRLSNSDEERWLVRALSTVVKRDVLQIGGDQALM